MRRLPNGDPVVCETDVVSGIPLCHAMEDLSNGVKPDPNDWVTGPPNAEFAGRELPLPITCPGCLEWMHA